MYKHEVDKQANDYHDKIDTQVSQIIATFNKQTTYTHTIETSSHIKRNILFVTLRLNMTLYAKLD